MLRLLTRLLEVLGLPAWMARTVARVAVFYGLLLLAVTVAKTGTNAIFLARAEPARLPFLYVAVAACVLVVTSILGRVLGRLTADRVLAIAMFAVTAAYVVLVGAVALGITGSTAALYVLGELHATALNILFWARVSDGFSPRNLRRAVGPISAGGMAGSVLGGLLMGGVAPLVGVLFPMIVCVGLSAGSLPLLSGLRSRSRRALGRARPAPAAAVRYLVQGPFPTRVAVLVAALAGLGAAVDFLFRLEAASLKGEDDMAVLFGLLNAAVGAAVVLFQSVITPRLLGRIGLFWFASLVPLGLLALAGVWTLFLPSFALLVGLKGLEMAGAFSLYNAAVTLLYNPMPTALKSQMRTLIDGAVKKGGAAAAGLLLGLYALRLDAKEQDTSGFLGPAVIGLAALVLALLPTLRRSYLDELDRRLGKRRRAHLPEPVIDTKDRATREALIARLDDEEPDRVLAALQALGEGFVLYPDKVVEMLGHKDERVREQALRHVPDRPDDDLTERLLAEIDREAARRPREEAIRALGRTAPDPSIAAPFLDDEDPGAVCAAIEVCLGWPETRREARRRLDALCRAPQELSPAFRRELSALIGRLDESRYDGALLALIDDEEVSVRLLAIAAAGRERHLALAPALIDALGDRRTRVAAREALVAFSDRATGALSRALDDARVPLAVRIHIPRVLAGIGTDDAARALLYSNVTDDAYLQQRIADRLVEIATRRPYLAVSRERASRKARHRIAAWAGYDEALDEIAALQADDERAERALRFLRRVLQNRREQNLRIAMQLLGLHRGLDRMMSAYRALTRGPGDDESGFEEALELLDTALAGESIRAELIGRLERGGGRPAAGPEAARAQVQLLARSPDPLLRAAARRVAAALYDLSVEEGASFRVIAAGAREVEGEDMPAPVVDRLLFLENVDLFEGLPVDDLAAIAAICTEEERPAGERLYAAGETGEHLYIVVDGRVQLSKEGQPLLLLSPGESLGQVSFLDRGPRPVDARVAGMGPARLIRIERGAFLDLLTDRPGLMHAFFGVLAARLRALIDRESGSGS